MEAIRNKLKDCVGGVDWSKLSEDEVRRGWKYIDNRLDSIDRDYLTARYGDTTWE